MQSSEFSNLTSPKLKTNKSEINIKICNYKLGVVNEFKYSAILIDKNLEYYSHMEMFKKSMAFRMEALLLYQSSFIPYTALIFGSWSPIWTRKQKANAKFERKNS